MLRDKLEEVLERIRADLRKEGGDIELVDVREDVVYVRLMGSCATCEMSHLTMKNWVEAAIRKDLPEIKQVKAI